MAREMCFPKSSYDHKFLSGITEQLQYHVCSLAQ